MALRPLEEWPGRVPGWRPSFSPGLTGVSQAALAQAHPTLKPGTRSFPLRGFPESCGAPTPGPFGPGRGRAWLGSLTAVHVLCLQLRDAHEGV